MRLARGFNGQFVEVGRLRCWWHGGRGWLSVYGYNAYGWLWWGDFSWQLKDRTGPIVQVMLGLFKASDFLTAESKFLLSVVVVDG